MTDHARILVAAPMMPDAAFKNTVFLVIQAFGETHIGVNLGAVTDAAGVRSGGPMEGDQKLTIGKFDNGEWGVAPDASEFSTADIAPETFTGFAAWALGQVDNEIAFGAWLVSTISLDDIMKLPPDQRYDAAFKATA